MNIEHPLNIRSIDDLKRVLEKYSVPWKDWEKSDTASTPERLFEDIKRRVCRLGVVDDTLVRYVEVVELYLYHEEARGIVRQLLEVERVLANGAVRFPQHASTLSAGIQPHEKPLHAARRVLAEQLGFKCEIPIAFVGDDPPILAPWSRTYPGIPTMRLKSNFGCLICKEIYRPEGYQPTIGEGANLEHVFFAWSTRPQQERSVRMLRPFRKTGRQKTGRTTCDQAHAHGCVHGCAHGCSRTHKKRAAKQ